MNNYISFLVALAAGGALQATAAPSTVPVVPPAPAISAATTVISPANTAFPGPATTLFVGQPTAFTTSANSFMPPLGGSMFPGAVGGQNLPGSISGGQLYTGTLGGPMGPVAFPEGAPTIPLIGLGGTGNRPVASNVATSPNAVIVTGGNGLAPPGGIVGAIPASGTSRVIVTGGATTTMPPGGTVANNVIITAPNSVIVTGGSSPPGGTVSGSDSGGTNQPAGKP